MMGDVEISYFVRVRASSKIRSSREGLKNPHEQNRVRYDTACSGVPRSSFAVARAVARAVPSRPCFGEHGRNCPRDRPQRVWAADH